MAQASKSAVVSESALMLVFLGVLMVAPLFGRPIDHSKLMTASPATTTELHPLQTQHTLPLPSSSAASTAAAAATTTSEFASDEQFKAAAHEVPSGPNPESN